MCTIVTPAKFGLIEKRYCSNPYRNGERVIDLNERVVYLQI